MQTVTREIERALSARLYYLALVSTLSLPNICSALESPNGETVAKQYKSWCANWFTSYPEVTSDDLYFLRCGVVHQGRLHHAKSQFSRILFTLPDGHGNVLHRNILSDALNLDLVTFCHDMINAVSIWYSAKQNDPNVVMNLPGLVQYREQGLAPHIGGIPLIA